MKFLFALFASAAIAANAQHKVLPAYGIYKSGADYAAHILSNSFSQTNVHNKLRNTSTHRVYVKNNDSSFTYKYEDIWGIRTRGTDWRIFNNKLYKVVYAGKAAVLLGSMLMLFATGSTLNLQSYMGIIMSTGVSVANAILIVTNAEALRFEYRDPFKAASVAAGIRLRPILMTSLAMIAGMIPMASGLGEAGDQSAPLGRAVIGGLAASTVAALFIVPLVYGWIQQNKNYSNVSLLPE